MRLHNDRDRRCEAQSILDRNSRLVEWLAARRDGEKQERLYGSNCYRAKPKRFDEFSNPTSSGGVKSQQASSVQSEQAAQRVKSNVEERTKSKFNFYLTKVNEVANANIINSHPSIGLKGRFLLFFGLKFLITSKIVFGLFWIFSISFSLIKSIYRFFM